MLCIPESVTKEDLTKALEIIVSECYPAMKFANALAGDTSCPEWKIIYSFSLDEIFAEAKILGIDIHLLKPAVGLAPLSSVKWIQNLSMIGS